MRFAAPAPHRTEGLVARGRLLPGILAVLSLLAGGCASTPDEIHGLDPDSAFDVAKAKYDAGEFELAAELFETIATEFPKSPRAEDSQFYRALALYGDNEHSDAVKLFQDFAKNNTRSSHLPAVEETLFQIGLDYLDGRAKGFLGLFTSEGSGVEVLEYVLTTFPRGKRGIDSQRILANYYFTDGDWAAALAEYQQLSKNYPRSEWKPVSDFRAGLCFLEQSRGWEYDRDLLVKARTTFEGYIHDFPEGSNVEEARGHVVDITATLAEKDYRKAALYIFWEKWTSARIFLGDVVKNYPDSPWAERARNDLVFVEEKLAAATPPEANPPKAAPAPGSTP